MKRCPNCNYENTLSNTHCERCGNSLTSSSSREPTYRMPGKFYPPDESLYEYPTPVREQTYQSSHVPLPPPPPGYTQLASGYQYTTTSQLRPRKRSIGGTVFSVLLYLLGIFCFLLASVGGVLRGTSNNVIGIIFISCALLSLVLLVLTLIFHKHPHLRWWVRLLSEIGLAVALFIGLIIAFALQSLTHAFSQAYLQNVVLGCIVALYGLLTAFLALW